MIFDLSVVILFVFLSNRFSWSICVFIVFFNFDYGLIGKLFEEDVKKKFDGLCWLFGK